MGRYLLVVRGDADRAKTEAERRGLTYVRPTSANHHNAANQARVIVEGPDRAVIDWFCESKIPPKGGFPAGTLLFYTSEVSREEAKSG